MNVWRKKSQAFFYLDWDSLRDIHNDLSKPSLTDDKKGADRAAVTCTRAWSWPVTALIQIRRSDFSALSYEWFHLRAGIWVLRHESRWKIHVIWVWNINYLVSLEKDIILELKKYNKSLTLIFSKTVSSIIHSWSV